MLEIKDVAMVTVMVLLSYFWGIGARMYGQSRDNQFFLDQGFTRFSKIRKNTDTPSTQSKVNQIHEADTKRGKSLHEIDCWSGLYYWLDNKSGTCYLSQYSNVVLQIFDYLSKKRFLFG